MMAEAYYELMREAGLDREGNGDAAAMRRMGDLLCDRFNFDAAVRWYMKAADQGDACSQYFLGRCYCKGNHGVEQNFADGAKWLRGRWFRCWCYICRCGKFGIFRCMRWRNYDDSCWLIWFVLGLVALLILCRTGPRRCGTIFSSLF